MPFGPELAQWCSEKNSTITIAAITTFSKANKDFRKIFDVQILFQCLQLISPFWVIPTQWGHFPDTNKHTTKTFLVDIDSSTASSICFVCSGGRSCHSLVTTYMQ